MKITVLSKRDVKFYNPSSNAAIIRITSQYPLTTLKGFYSNIIELFFDDISYDNNDPDNIANIISDIEAKEIINFVKNLSNNCHEIVVHCDYGEGRSPAVAAAISRLFNQNFDMSKYPKINKLVYDKIISFII